MPPTDALHKGGQINNVQLITGGAEMSHLQNISVKIFKEHCRYFTIRKNKKIGGMGRGNLQLITGVGSA